MLSFLPYRQQSVESWPQTGRHIIAQYDENSVVVYQAYCTEIAMFAVENQRFGGEKFNFGRMSWIKTNFTWMMYRSGWSYKDRNQERILAIRIKRAFFEKLLREAVHSSYIKELHASEEVWKKKVRSSMVRIQWDPDHTPFDNYRLARRAIQLGMRGEVLQEFSNDVISSIEDITDFVRGLHSQYSENPTDLVTPKEEIYTVNDARLKAALFLDDL